MKLGRFICAIIITSIFFAPYAFARSQIVTANIKFDTPLTQQKINDIEFGAVKAGQSGAYVISTSNTVTPASGGIWLYGSPSAGTIKIAGSSSQSVTISTGSYLPDHGVTPSSATCKYGTATPAPCDGGVRGSAPGAATTLLVGVQVVADGTQAAGTVASPSFAVSVVYN